MEWGLHYAVILPLATLALTVAGLLLASREHPLAVRLWRPTLLAILVAWLIYMIPFITLDYRLAEVAKNSSNDLSFPIRVATSWSGGGSSLFFFTTVTAAGLLLVSRAQEKPQRVLLLAGYFTLLLGLSSALLNGAFDVVEGIGGLDLNPLLKSYWIIPHPLTTFGGYALILVGALGVLNNLGRKAIASLLAGWSLLTLGITFGGYWSYETFGWGGYWAWDPVEVAELTVWLAATTLLHMLGPLQALRLPFAALAASSVPLALYVTRSGLSPLHSFAAADVGAMVLLGGSLVFLAITLVLLGREGLAGQVVKGIRKAMAERNLSLIALTVGAFSLIVMNLFVYASLLAPSVLTALGQSATIPTMAEGVRFYHPVLYPLAVLLVAALPGYFLAKEIGGLGYLGLLVTALALGGVAAAGVDKGILTFSPLESKVTNLKIAIGLPLSTLMAGALLVSLAHGVVEARKKSISPATLLRDGGLRVLHIGVILTFMGVLLSGGFSFNDQYFQTYNVKPGQPVEFGDLRITLVDYEYFPGRGEVDLYSHVSGKRTTAFVAWQAIDLLANDVLPAIREIRLASSNEESRSVASDISSLLDADGPIGVDWLNATGRGNVVLAEIVTNTNATLLNNGSITLAVKSPLLIVELNPIVSDAGELKGAWLGFGVEGKSIMLIANLTGQDVIAGTHSYYILNFSQPLVFDAGDLKLAISEAALYPSLEGINETRGPARPVDGGVELFNSYIVVTQGTVEYKGRAYEVPYEVNRGLYLYILTQRGEAVVLEKILESPLANMLGDLRVLAKAAGLQPGDIALPRNALSGVRLALDFQLESTSSGEKWAETALVRFEANGEAIGIHGLVTDVIIVRKGLTDIYISVQPPIVRGFFDTYHEPLIYYVKESTKTLPPEQALSLTGLMAAGYNIGSVTSLGHVEAGFVVEQAMLDLLLLAEDFDPSNSTLLYEGLPIMIKVVPSVNLVWLGVALMSAAGFVLALGYVFSRKA